MRGPVLAVAARAVLAWLALAGLGRVSALTLPGSLWIAVAVAWAVSEPLFRLARTARRRMERRLEPSEP